MSLINRLKAQHQETDRIAINNTLFCRFLALLALRITAPFYKHYGVCFPISRDLIIKTGPFVDLTEAATMRFLAENTSLPIPKVFCSFIHNNQAYIVMERIQGEPIAKVLKNLSKGSKEKLFTQLRSLITQLRTLTPPDGAPKVASCIEGSLRDSRIRHCSPRMGPFTTIEDFHSWLRRGLQVSDIEGQEDTEENRSIAEMIAKQDGPWPPQVFTHGDLNPSNILVHGDQIVGIIDWEFSGWYPHYWEYTSAWLGGITKWQSELKNFLDAYPEELDMEKTRYKWWGE